MEIKKGTAIELIDARCNCCGKRFYVELNAKEKEGTTTGSVLRDCPRCGESVYVWTGKVKQNY